MGQRVIVVPKDRLAQELLDRDEATDQQLLELYLSDEEFYFLYKRGIFALINQIAGSLIDDFENDSVLEKEKILKIIESLNAQKAMFTNEWLVIIQKIVDLFEEALKRGTGVHFYF
ncbi:MAG: hypothetical protein KIT80_09790 [Chitinophagaceae bacterium]|nr:hypothetical protein [Chitinophagaceae bacterium]MCW5927191.1 hypothetical protein [Chitinophagaceae bacterium]